MAEPFVAGNWKMNTTVSGARSLATELRGAIDDVSGVTKVVCPPFVSLAPVADILAGSSIRVGAQDVNPNAQGAYTGEVSADMLAEICDYVIVGHSERRALFHETDADVSAKAAAAIAHGLTPIVCVGESEQQRDAGSAIETVSGQVKGSLSEISSVTGIVIAYEPVWAIGTGRAASPDIAQEMMSAIRDVLAGRYGQSEASGVPLLYGGSVNPGNAADFFGQSDVNGALVGGASLKPGDFASIVKAAASAAR